MLVKDLIKVLQSVDETACVYVEMQQNRNRAGQQSILNSIEIEEELDGVTLKGIMNSPTEERA